MTFGDSISERFTVRGLVVVSAAVFVALAGIYGAVGAALASFLLFPLVPLFLRRALIRRRFAREGRQRRLVGKRPLARLPGAASDGADDSR